MKELRQMVIISTVLFIALFTVLAGQDVERQLDRIEAACGVETTDG